ncbi:MAG: TRAP transporter small permease [Rhodospirillales bacterium]|jgi:TRAP-type transport system small permease protein|nr:TRAP transporter small permease [Rhodospirillales bacterium]
MILTIFWRIIGYLRKTVDIFVCVCFIFMICGVLVQVAGRYVFNYSIAGTEEAARFAQVWMVLVGAGVAMRFGKHVAIDAVMTYMPIKMARILNLFIAIGCVGFLVVVIVGAQPLMMIGQFETSPAMEIPMWTMYLCLTVGSVYFAIEVILLLIQRWDDPCSKNMAQE